jgi:hypothetical protein
VAGVAAEAEKDGQRLPHQGLGRRQPVGSLQQLGQVVEFGKRLPGSIPAISFPDAPGAECVFFIFLQERFSLPAGWEDRDLPKEGTPVAGVRK